MLYANGLYGAIGAVILVRDELLPSRWKSDASLLDILHKLHWREWVIVLLLLNILLLIEGTLRAVRNREEKVSKLTEKLEAIESSSPKIRAVFAHVKPVRFLFSGGTTGIHPFISVRFINDPIHPSQTAIAKDICAKLRHFIPDTGNTLLEVDGRWAGSDQPSSRNWLASKSDLLRTDFNIG